MARPSIEDKRSKTFSNEEPPSACGWNNAPFYAPDLNADEGIWNDLKRVELGNVCCSDLDHLHRELIRARERLRHKREIIRRCSRQCGYVV
jgi:transposase